MRNPSIDALRGVAILLVLGAHFPSYPFWARISWSGVNLFFVLSGFLVSGLLFDSLRRSGSVQARRFVIRRGFKIWPSFYIFLLAYGLIALLRGVRPYPLRTVLDAAFFIQNYTGIYDGVLTAHVWSLCVEEHFYLLLPLLFLTAIYLLGPNKAPRGIAIAAIGSLPICFFLRLRVAREGEYLHQSHLLLDALFFGVLLSYLYRFHRERFQALSSIRFGLTGAVLLLPMALGIETNRMVQTFGITLGSIGFGLLLCFSVDRWPTNRFVAAPLRGLSWVGFYSYSIYLWHVIVRFFVFAFVRSPFGFWIYVASSIVAGVTMAQIIEQPFLRIRDRVFSGRLIASQS